MYINTSTYIYKYTFIFIYILIKLCNYVACTYLSHFIYVLKIKFQQQNSLNAFAKVTIWNHFV